MDDIYTPVKNGEIQWVFKVVRFVGQQTLFCVIINQGVMLSIAILREEQRQNHDLFEIQTLFDELCELLKKVNIN